MFASSVLLLLQYDISLIVLTNIESSPCLPRRDPLTCGKVFPFLSLAVDLQYHISGRLVSSADLKAVCLVSKHVAAMAAPFLYLHHLILAACFLTESIKFLSELGLRAYSHQLVMWTWTQLPQWTFFSKTRRRLSLRDLTATGQSYYYTYANRVSTLRDWNRSGLTEKDDRL